ncbi:MAG: hypothetical protein QOE70_6357 [Chthoniobacter sp.]|jgi:hypothetical protein|nr:hypothetical protein [Chthoniobacter sp.]
MLTDQPIKEVAGDLPRRWMSDDYFDLVVWYEVDHTTIHGFQLCYGKPDHGQALTWIDGRGFSHTAIDSGEESPEANRTPVLSSARAPFPAAVVREAFLRRTESLDPTLRDLVLSRIHEYATGAP